MHKRVTVFRPCTISDPGLIVIIFLSSLFYWFSLNLEGKHIKIEVVVMSRGGGAFNCSLHFGIGFYH